MHKGALNIHKSCITLFLTIKVAHKLELIVARVADDAKSWHC